MLGHAAYSFGRTDWMHEVDDAEYDAAVTALRREGREDS